MDENRTHNSRVGSISFNVQGMEGAAKVLKFTQEAIAQYFLPAFVWGAESSISDIIDAENARRNEVVVVPAPASPPYQKEQPYYEFKTHSTIFPIVKYQTLNLGTKFVFKSILVANDRDVFESESFKQFMLEEGFKLTGYVKVTDGYRVTYVNDSRGVDAAVIVNRLNSEIVFIPHVKQPHAMPTVDKWYHFGDKLEFEVSTPKDVEDYEKTINGKRDEWWCDYLTEQTQVKTELYHSDEPFFSRWYFFKRNKLSEMKYVFSTLNVGYYEYGGLYFLTDEFRALMEQNGFVENLAVRDISRNVFGFDNKKLGLRLMTTRNTWNEKPVFAYHLFNVSNAK